MSNVTESINQTAKVSQLGHSQQAEQFYKQILQKDPQNPYALHSLGLIAYKKGQSDIALDLIGKAISINNNIPELHNSSGLILEAFGRFSEAINSYKHAVSIKPDYSDAYHNMAIAMQSIHRYDEAVTMCQKAISYRSDYAEAYNTMGYCLQKQNRPVEAIESFRRALQYKPALVEAYNHLGTLLYELGRSAEAIDIFRKAIQYDSAYSELYNNMGMALKDQEQFEEAIDNFKQAIRLEPDFTEAYYNLANSLRDQGQCEQALELYQQAIRLKPDYAQAHWNMALALLLKGDYEKGWQGYKWRRNTVLKNITDYRCFGKPRWDGSNFAGKRLLVHYEQGLGDNIQFARYLPMLKTRGGTVVFEILDPLRTLFQNFPGIDELIIYEHGKKPSVEFDLYTSLFDLPSIFKTTLETTPCTVPYIHTDPAKVEYWRNQIAGPDFKVGIAWAGSPVHGNDRYRSCSLSYFEPLSKIEGIKLFGLQKGQAASQMDQFAGKIPVINISKQFFDFSDTAAAIENLDLVISVDTSVLHLAGAMGKPTWALLPFAPEWRWMLNRTDSPWYPTITLFRQQQWGQWEQVFERMAAELRRLTGGNCTRY